MWLNIVLIVAGLVLLERGASWFVNGSSALARKLHVSELTIGLTIVAFGTSAPELVVNSFAASSSNHDIVFGNIRISIIIPSRPDGKGADIGERTGRFYRYGSQGISRNWGAKCS